MRRDILLRPGVRTLAQTSCRSRRLRWSFRFRQWTCRIRESTPSITRYIRIRAVSSSPPPSPYIEGEGSPFAFLRFLHLRLNKKIEIKRRKYFYPFLFISIIFNIYIFNRRRREGGGWLTKAHFFPFRWSRGTTLSHKEVINKSFRTRSCEIDPSWSRYHGNRLSLSLLYIYIYTCVPLSSLLRREPVFISCRCERIANPCRYLPPPATFRRTLDAACYFIYIYIYFWSWNVGV